MAIVVESLPGTLEQRISSMLSIYRNARQSLNRVLQRAMITDFTRYRASQSLEEVERIIDALNALARRNGKGLVSEAYDHGATVTDKALADAGLDLAGIDKFNMISTDAVSVLANQITQDLVTANTTLKGNVARLLRETHQLKTEERIINEAIARGVITGETRRDTSERIRQRLMRDLDGATKITTINPKGVERHFDPEYYAEMVARTRTREASTAGTVNSALSFGVGLFQVSVHDGACDICVGYQGKVYAIRDGMGYPILNERPPYHPHCRHVLWPYVAVAGEEWLREFSNSGRIVESGTEWVALQRRAAA